MREAIVWQTRPAGSSRQVAVEHVGPLRQEAVSRRVHGDADRAGRWPADYEGLSPAAILSNSLRSTLPTALRGKASITLRSSGTLYDASRRATF
jgi:hypothetical protein